jgi:hypothetical protein
MGAVHVSGPNAPDVQSAEEMVGRFQSELISQLPDWKQRLSADPAELEPLEREVQAAFARGADLLVAGLLAVVMQQAEFLAAAERTRQTHRFPLARGRPRQIRVRLLGGLLIWVTSLYCGPRKSLFRRREEDVPGLYVELAQFGFGKGVTPGLQSRVARQAALCPSFESAQQELERSGVQLDGKTVRRITYQCGVGLLAVRRHQVMQWRAGQLPAGTELKGKRVTVQIDGGRTKIRGPLKAAPVREEKTDADGLVVENAPGRSRARPKQTYDADWREPKLVTIFVHDEQGRMVKGSQATVDGTFLGPDALAELTAMHLHRLGAAEALSVTFVSDGAPWIWDRVPQIVALAKLDQVQIYEVLDCCHAAHHISLALAALGLTERERMPLYRELRTQLRNGHWRGVVETLTEVALDPRLDKFQTELAYLRKHGEAGRLSYVRYRTLGLPLGSGAIESGIRRVINLRLKGNGMFWRKPQAEAMLQIRAQVLTNRWDERLRQMRELARQDGRPTWEWEPQNLSPKSEPAAANVQSPAKTQ